MNRTSKVSLLATTLFSCVVAGQSALAQKPDAWYLGADVGYVEVNDMDLDFLGAAEIPHDADFDEGLAYSVQLGYGFSGPRVELELGRRDNDVDKFGRASNVKKGTGSMEATTFMLNGLYDLQLGQRWFPYVGVGLGAADVEADNIRSRVAAPQRTGVLDGDDTVFAWQLIGGVAYRVHDRWSLKLDYKYLNASDVEFDYGDGCDPAGANCIYEDKLEDDYEAHTFSLGLRWHF